MNSTLIGQRLVQLRGDKTQQEVSKAVNISISALSMYELGLRNPRDSVKVRLADYFKTTVEDIFFSL